MLVVWLGPGPAPQYEGDLDDVSKGCGSPGFRKSIPDTEVSGFEGPREAVLYALRVKGDMQL